MDYRRPGFLTHSYDSALSPSPPSVSSTSDIQDDSGRLRKIDKVLTGEHGWWEGTESYDGEKAWLSIIHNIPYSLI